MSATIPRPIFRERFAVAAFPDGGVVIDLVTGTYTRLNRSATVICEALVAADDASSAARLAAQHLRIDSAEALRSVEEVVLALDTPSPRRDRPDPFRYAPAPDHDGYILSSNGSPRLWISANGLLVRAVSTGASTAIPLSEYLRAAAPKLLFLQGAAVLHGAACQGVGGLTAFCGESGAGKTTTAHAFSSAGANLFSEDMLVVASLSPLTVHSRGEETIRQWALDAADRFNRASNIDASGLQAALAGPPEVVREMWFISAEHRVEGSGRILPRRLGATDGALAVMASVFLGATAPPEWRRFLSLAGGIATSTPLFEARMPQGLDSLREAAVLYAQNSAS